MPGLYAATKAALARTITMTLILKTVEKTATPADCYPEHSVHADVTSCHFRRYSDGSGAEALIYCREPVKTAMVPGFHEVEKCVTFTGTAYLMNENGRTVSTFEATAPGGTPWSDIEAAVKGTPGYAGA